jgi:hypothetical protein
MKCLALALALLGATTAAAGAQDAAPDLRGTWSGKGKAVIFGSNLHHPGTQTAADAPRVREIEATYIVEGQDGRLAWGRSSSAVADTKEPFAWAIASDNKSIFGADLDGYFGITLLTPDRMEKCYVQNGISPTHSSSRRATSWIVSDASQTSSLERRAVAPSPGRAGRSHLAMGTP